LSWEILKTGDVIEGPLKVEAAIVEILQSIKVCATRTRGKLYFAGTITKLLADEMTVKEAGKKAPLHGDKEPTTVGGKQIAEIEDCPEGCCSIHIHSHRN